MAALAAIALGSNLPSPIGSSEQTLQYAIQRLRDLGAVTAISCFLRTAPVGFTDQPDFLNAAVLLQTTLPPVALLHELLVIEQEARRDRSHGIPKGPRSLDMDLLLYGDSVLENAELTLPHPEMHRRRFVLQPLAEIAPHLRHPVIGRTIEELLRDLPD